MPLLSAKKPWCFYRLGPTKEKGLFKKQRDTYDGVIVPAHIASYFSKFCTEFVGSLGKPYFIDPLTYIFANDPSFIRRFIKDKETGRTIRDRFGVKKKGDIKRSYLKLVEEDYKGVVKKVVDKNRSITPKDFAKAEVRKKFVSQVISFQLNRLSEIPPKYKKYEKWIPKGKSRSKNPPMCVVAPYFPVTTLGPRGWHQTNLDFIKLSIAQSDDTPVFAVILASTEILVSDIVQIADDYIKAGADGFLLWPDGFLGRKATPAILKTVFSSVEELSKHKKPVMLMYGDAYAMALHYAGLTGFACGICYGEEKSSSAEVDIEGGLPPRYYLSKLKKKVQIEPETMRIKIEQYPDLICECSICRRKPDPVQLTDTESKEHFMLARLEEIKMLRAGIKRGEYAELLRAAFLDYKDNPLLQPVGHLLNWADVLAKPK